MRVLAQPLPQAFCYRPATLQLCCNQPSTGRSGVPTIVPGASLRLSTAPTSTVGSPVPVVLHSGSQVGEDTAVPPSPQTIPDQELSKVQPVIHKVHSVARVTTSRGACPAPPVKSGTACLQVKRFAVQPGGAYDGSGSIRVSRPVVSRCTSAATRCPSPSQDDSPTESPRRHVDGGTRLAPRIESILQPSPQLPVQQNSSGAHLASTGESVMPSPQQSPKASFRQSASAAQLACSVEGSAQASPHPSPNVPFRQTASATCLASTGDGGCRQPSPHTSPLLSYRNASSATHLGEGVVPASVQPSPQVSYRRTRSTARLPTKGDGLLSSHSTSQIVPRIVLAAPVVASTQQTSRSPSTQRQSNQPSPRIVFHSSPHSSAVFAPSPGRRSQAIRMSSIPLTARAAIDPVLTGPSRILQGVSVTVSPCQSPRLSSPHRVQRPSVVWAAASTAPPSSKSASPPRLKHVKQVPSFHFAHWKFGAAAGLQHPQGQRSLSRGPRLSGVVLQADELLERAAAWGMKKTSFEDDVRPEPLSPVLTAAMLSPMTVPIVDAWGDPLFQASANATRAPSADSRRDASALDKPEGIPPEMTLNYDIPPRRRRWSNEDEQRRCAPGVIAPVKAPPQACEDINNDELSLSNTCLGLQQKLASLMSEEALRGGPSSARLLPREAAGHCRGLIDRKSVV